MEKSLFVATDLKVAITDEEFEGGKNIVCTKFLESMMCNDAEQEIRQINLQNKYGDLLGRRAEKKREAEDEEGVPKPKKAVGKRKTTKGAYGRPGVGEKPAEVQKSSKIDYERFNDYLKDVGGRDEFLDFS